jgi:hypothetical protein
MAKAAECNRQKAEITVIKNNPALYMEENPGKIIKKFIALDKGFKE